MKPLLQSAGLLIFLLWIFSFPAAAAYYDQNGVLIDKAQYEKSVQMRAPEINKINTEGYAESSSRLEDPVRLRNRRIEQWRSQQKKDHSR